MTANQTINESVTAETLVANLQRLGGAQCPGCHATLCHHHALLSVAMGFGDRPLCFNCLAAALRHEPIALRQSLLDYIQRRECYRTAWAWANRAEGVDPDSMIGCLLAFGPPARSQSPPLTTTATHHAMSDASPPSTPDAEWDAGDMGCGELVLELRLRLEAMQPGQIFKLVARDPGAPEDLPAWCRLTGHRLLRAERPTYWIERKD